MQESKFIDNLANILALSWFGSRWVSQTFRPVGEGRPKAFPQRFLWMAFASGHPRTLGWKLTGFESIRSTTRGSCALQSVTMERPRYLTDIHRLDRLSVETRQHLSEVSEAYSFYANTEYLSLIDWDDPDDPIRRIIIPSRWELEAFGTLDPSNEKAYLCAPSLQHKYADTALLMVSRTCAGLCRYCFRKRLFLTNARHIDDDVSAAFEYITAHQEITNVLLTGGDALSLPTRRLDTIMTQLRRIPHVRIIRLGSKMPAFDPARILDDPDLAAVITKHTELRRRVYVMAHFDHPRELTDAALRSIQVLQRAGAIVYNQCPLVTGVNDNADTLALLWKQLAFSGVVSHYLFQCRPTVGNAAFSVPIEHGFEIYSEARSRCAGTASKAEFVISHASGKVQVTGLTEHHVHMRYSRAHLPRFYGRQLVFRRNARARWLDDYSEARTLLNPETHQPNCDARRRPSATATTCRSTGQRVVAD